MRGLAVVMFAACTNTHTLPEPTELDAIVNTYVVDGDTVYWTTEQDGDLILKHRSPNSTGQVWRRSLDGRVAYQLLSGPDGIFLAEVTFNCGNLTWIHRDRTNE